MPSHSGLAALAEGAILSPFTQLRRLLHGIEPGHAKPIDLTIGEPREAMPPFVAAKLMEAVAEYGKYPPIRGTQALRSAIAAWVGRRYGAAATPDATREVLALNGSREGLFLAAIPAAGRKRVNGRAAVLMCNPYYSAYIGGALAVDAEPVYLNATAASGHLPDLEALAGDEALLDRTVALYLCSPANPQGAVASKAYIACALELARAHDFMLFFDECYSEIYTGEPPPGALAVAAATPQRFRNLVAFNSLSKRSNLPGLRSGFCAGDDRFLETFAEIRNMVAPQVPGPTQHVSVAVWEDEAHVAANREAYRAKFDVCDCILAGRYGYYRPAGGFCLWLDVSKFGGASDAAVTLWKRGGVKVLPGAFLAQAGRDGTNPGGNYVRLALVHDAATIAEALERFVVVLA
ncbi:MAG TPA: aminotransferase class I/II-fold pyridoxal phosphate-dependent enzyme [Hyphomicrobium sp.]|nr:aminotransferase class I/II-fold pyridoxal phosphate-dependent enzyme [Hyphomicrobium sp.]